MIDISEINNTTITDPHMVEKLVWYLECFKYIMQFCSRTSKLLAFIHY